jgi:hypothetical protein
MTKEAQPSALLVFSRRDVAARLGEEFEGMGAVVRGVRARLLVVGEDVAAPDLDDGVIFGVGADGVEIASASGRDRIQHPFLPVSI